MQVFAFRPEPGLASTVAAGQRAGLDIVATPLSTIEPVDWRVPDGASFDGLLIGSANAIRHGGEQLAQLRALPVYCVGQATADAARNAGFAVAATGSGGLQTVLDGLTGQEMALLRLSGEERVTLRPTARVTVSESTVYRAKCLPLAANYARRIEGNLALLHSAATARHFAQECDRLGLARGQIAIAALGPRIAAAAGPGWRSVSSAERPDDASLLALAAQHCKTHR